MRSIKSQRIISRAIKQKSNLTNGVLAGYSDLKIYDYDYVENGLICIDFWFKICLIFAK